MKESTELSARLEIKALPILNFERQSIANVTEKVMPTWLQISISLPLRLLVRLLLVGQSDLLLGRTWKRLVMLVF